MLAFMKNVAAFFFAIARLVLSFVYFLATCFAALISVYLAIYSFMTWGIWAVLILGVVILGITVAAWAIEKTSSGSKPRIDPKTSVLFKSPGTGVTIDQHVRFTVYRPDKVRPQVWTQMLAFAYRGGDNEEEPGDIKASFKEVESQAAAVLGSRIQGFSSITTENRSDIPRGTSLRFVPRASELEFNPPNAHLCGSNRSIKRSFDSAPLKARWNGRSRSHGSLRRYRPGRRDRIRHRGGQESESD